MGRTRRRPNRRQLLQGVTSLDLSLAGCAGLAGYGPRSSPPIALYPGLKLGAKITRRRAC